MDILVNFSLRKSFPYKPEKIFLLSLPVHSPLKIVTKIIDTNDLTYETNKHGESK